MYYKEQFLDELYQLKHRHDDDVNFVDYEKDILNKTLSPKMFENDRMFTFLDGLRLLLTKLFDNYNIIKNFKNYNVDKYYYKHKN
jgi:hypothetical protein